MKNVTMILVLMFCPAVLAAQHLDSPPVPVTDSGLAAFRGAQPKVDRSSARASVDLASADTGAAADFEHKQPLASASTKASFRTDVRPLARPEALPRTRWQHMEGHTLWTRTALSALKDHGKPLVDLVPGDIANWCPAYPQASDADRRAFWVGFLSALAKHESTYRPWAVGGGGKWYGLLQILPGTARGYDCRARSGAALKDGGANLSCAIRIMAVTVPRDGVIHGYKNKKGRGVTADWGPMHSSKKRRDMAGWLRKQSYCKPLGVTRPKQRPS